jgi:hypothetical protein
MVNTIVTRSLQNEYVKPRYPISLDNLDVTTAGRWMMDRGR